MYNIRIAAVSNRQGTVSSAKSDITIVVQMHTFLSIGFSDSNPP